MNKLFSLWVTGAALVLSANAANASTAIVLSPGGGSGSYNADSMPGASLIYPSATSTVLKAFTDTYTFSLLRGGYLSLLFTSQDKSTNRYDNVNFSSLKLIGPTSATITTFPNGVNETSETFGQGILVAPGSYTLTLKGVTQSAGSYNADLTFAIPEPALWAMMILGMGATGAALRIRRRKVAFAA